VIDAVARRDHIRLLIDGMTAVNDLAPGAGAVMNLAFDQV